MVGAPTVAPVDSDLHGRPSFSYGGDGVTSPVIDMVAVSKRFGEVLAVDEVSVRVEHGEIYALLGLNGAGKTTLIRMLLGMVRPTGGTVALFGEPVECPRACRVGSRGLPGRDAGGLSGAHRAGEPGSWYAGGGDWPTTAR